MDTTNVPWSIGWRGVLLQVQDPSQKCGPQASISFSFSEMLISTKYLEFTILHSVHYHPPGQLWKEIYRFATAILPTAILPTAILPTAILPTCWMKVKYRRSKVLRLGLQSCRVQRRRRHSKREWYIPQEFSIWHCYCSLKEQHKSQA